MIRTLASLSLAALLLAGCAATPSTPASPVAAAPASEPPPPLREEPAPPPAVHLDPAAAEFTDAAKALDTALHAQVAERGVARSDGYVYGMDVATLMLYAAQRGDADLYGKLLPVAQTLILQNPDDPYTRGFVLWRTKDGAKLGRSGAADALWMARALWTGARAFNRDDDRALALAVLDGYAKHAYVLQGVWLARNSFDFGTRSFASVSLLPAYQADFLAEAERRSGRGTDWKGFGERSYRLLERAVTPSRLLLPVVQPEVGANYPGAGLDLYAPNGVTSLEASCLAAEGAAAGLPKLAAGVAEFAADGARAGKLRAAYNTDDGSAAGDAPLSGDGYACLERLAAATGNSAALAVLDPRIAAQMQAAAKARGQLPGSGPLLLAALARGAF